MQDRQTYEYAIIRVVPKVEREEFMNVGAILYSKNFKYLGIRYHIDENRLLAFAPETDLELISSYLSAWKLICDGSKDGGYIGTFDIASRFRWLTASRSTMIQSSPIHPGLCFDPEEVLEDLFQRYVL